MRNVAIFCAVAVVIALTVYRLTQWRPVVAPEDHQRSIGSGTLEPLPDLDARGVVGVQQIAKSELLSLMSKMRPLLQSEKTQVDRGCPGLTCLYQGLGLTTWPESARGTRAYVRFESALSRSCPESGHNFVFVKQAWWTGGKPPTTNPNSGEVPLSSVTRTKPGW